MGRIIQECLQELPTPAALHRAAVANAACNQVKVARLPRFALVLHPDAHHFAYDNGGGDSAIAVFSPTGVLLKGFDHESRASSYAHGRVLDGVYAGLPAGLRRFVLEPGGAPDPADEDRFPGKLDGEDVELAPATFAAWWTGGRWQCGTLDLPEVKQHMAGDGSGWIVGAIVRGTDRFVEDSHYGYDPAIVDKIAAQAPLTDAEIRALDPAADVAAVRQRFAAIGYGAPVPFGLGS